LAEQGDIIMAKNVSFSEKLTVAALTAGSIMCLCTWRASAQTNESGAASAKADSEIVVTASRAQRDIQSEPRTVYRLKSENAVAEDAARTMPDTLKGIPSVMVQKTGYGQGSPFLRGFTGFRILAMIDGVRLNNSVFRDGPNQYCNTVDPFSLSGSELVMGPSSVLYGSDAVGGVINAISTSAPAFTNSASYEAKLSARIGSADESVVGRAQLGLAVSEQLSLLAGLTGKSFGDIRGGKDVGKQEHTGYDETAYDLHMDYSPDSDSRMTVVHQSVDQQDAWRTHRTIYGIKWEGLSAGDDKVHSYDQYRELTYVQYRTDLQGSLADRFQCAISRQAQSEDLYRVRKDGRSDLQGFDVVTWGATLQLESGTLLGKWVYGAEYYHDTVDSYSRRYKANGALDKIEIQGPVADDARYESVGLFAEDTIQIMDGGMDVIPGVRYNYARADADKVKDPVTGKQTEIAESWSSVVASLRILKPLAVDRSCVIFTGISQGFRAPNLSDLTRLDSARSNEIETPSPDLDPEQFIACEAGLKSRVGRLTSQISYYYTVIDKMILRTPTGLTIDDMIEVTKKNSGDGYIQGAEMSGTYRLTDEWSTHAAVSWTDGKVNAYPTSKDEKKRDYITRLMPVTAQAGLRWENTDNKYWAAISVDAADKADKLSADDRRDTQRIPPGGTPGYIVCSMRAGIRPAKGMDIALAVENIFDEDYRIHGSGVNEAGRNFILTAGYAF
jgi:hemoglobin/transferrin/lactoferrin receptor protein